MALKNAGFEGTNQATSIPLISKLSCALVAAKQTVNIKPGTLTFQAYGKEVVVEHFNCNYGLNENYRNDISTRGLNIVGTDTNGAARIIELDKHRFFIATLFLPQISSSPNAPHPLIVSYLKAAASFQGFEKGI